MADFIIRDSRKPGMVLHPSTECALEGLKEVSAETSNLKPETILDIGCGSGLLSLAAASLWPEARIMASDISVSAVADAAENVRAHGLEDRISVLRADGYDHPEIRAQGPYDLILCNLLADILIRTSPDLKAQLAPGGLGVLSGILAWMQPQVAEAHAALGFEIIGEIEMQEWRAMLIRQK